MNAFIKLNSHAKKREEIGSKWRLKAGENKGLWRRTREPKWRSKACTEEERKKTNEEDEGREKTNVGCTDEEEARKKKTQKAFGKGRRRRNSKGCPKDVCKRCRCFVIRYQNANHGLAFIDSSCLVKKTIGRVMTLRKT